MKLKDLVRTKKTFFEHSFKLLLFGLVLPPLFIFGDFFFAPSFCQAENLASFDCQKATGPLEKTICSDPELAKMDRQMSLCYKDRLNKAGKRQSPKTVAAQRAWIRKRNTCKTNIECLKKHYKTFLSQYKCPWTTEEAEQKEPEKSKETADLLAREELLQKLSWSDSVCEETFKSLLPKNLQGRPAPGVQEFILGDGYKLYIFFCDLVEQPYRNDNYRAVVFNEKTGKSKPVEFKKYIRRADGTTEVRSTSAIWGTFSFRRRDKTLTTTSQLRLFGDCGDQVTYEFNNGDFKVIRAKAQYCREEKKKRIYDPDKWLEVENP